MSKGETSLAIRLRAVAESCAMGFRHDLERRIEKKGAEINDLKTKLGHEESYLNGLLEALKLAPRESMVPDNAQQAFRAGSMTAKAYKALKSHGKPMHVKTLLEVIGKAPTRTNYSSLSSSINAYAKRGEIFLKTEPNTFGLLEFGGESAPTLFSGASGEERTM